MAYGFESGFKFVVMNEFVGKFTGSIGMAVCDVRFQAM